MARGRPLLNGPPIISRIPMFLDLWNRAIASPHGIKIKPAVGMTPHHFAAQLYTARRECGHTAYNGYRVVEGADGYVWIMPR